MRILIAAAIVSAFAAFIGVAGAVRRAVRLAPAEAMRPPAPPRFGPTLLERLGRHSLGAGGCLYVNKLADIDLAVLEQIVALGWKTSLETYPD